MTEAVASPHPSAARVTRRWRRLLWLGLPGLLLAFALNHIEYSHRRKEVLKSEPSVVVRVESGLFAGHNTLGIDESRTAADGPSFLRFSLLERWAFDRKAPSPCPADVSQWNGKDVSCLGFMYPLEPGGTLKSFCLLRTTQTCCYGPRPQWNQYLLVEMREAVKMERLRPVVVRGVFHTDPQPEQGFIYRMEGTAATPVADDEPDTDAAEAAREAKLPLFDFANLEAVKESGKVLAPALQAQDGKRTLVAGYFSNLREGNVPQLLVGRYWWDGASKGKPPGIYNAVLVFPREASQLPPAWKEKGLFCGTLRVEPDPAKWAANGIVSLRDAERGVPGAKAAPVLAVDRGPVLEMWHEALLLGAFLWLVIRLRPVGDSRR